MSDERSRGQLPKAYLRIDPNLDSTHPAPGDMVALLCAANRQPRRGWFKSVELAHVVLGKALYRRCMDRGDLLQDGESVYVPGWDEWQEGDLNVGERMRRLRERRRNSAVTNAVTPPSPARISPSEASRRLGVRRSIDLKASPSSEDLDTRDLYPGGKAS